MRLSDKEIALIKSNSQKLFGDALVYIFGSRIDESKRGGDIDIYIDAKEKKDLFRKKLRLKSMLEDSLYKPVDVIVSTDKEKIIDIIDIDLWSEFRAVRNSISHDYPHEESDKLEAMNYLIKNVGYLIGITEKIKDNLETLR